MKRGALIVVPNTLDLGAERAPDIRDVLPLATIAGAARLAHWAVENAKSARAFLKRVNDVVPLALPLQALRISELPRAPKGRDAGTVDCSPLLAPARDGHDLGLLSEAGLPGVADPGAALVAAAHDAGVEVRVLSGPSALTMALAASGLDGQHFAFVGYLPTAADARATRIRELDAWSARSGQTQVVIETPYRNGALLAALLDHLRPQTRLAVSCGLTLADSWTRSANISRWRAEPTALPNDVPAVFAFRG
jgi:16S rRNA (cytidine1402-2'-O)-methyltransferase